MIGTSKKSLEANRPEAGGFPEQLGAECRATATDTQEVGKQGAASCSESGTGQANVAVSIHITWNSFACRPRLASTPQQRVSAEEPAVAGDSVAWAEEKESGPRRGVALCTTLHGTVPDGWPMRV